MAERWRMRWLVFFEFAWDELHTFYIVPWEMQPWSFWLWGQGKSGWPHGGHIAVQCLGLHFFSNFMACSWQFWWCSCKVLPWKERDLYEQPLPWSLGRLDCFDLSMVFVNIATSQARPLCWAGNVWGDLWSRVLKIRLQRWMAWMGIDGYGWVMKWRKGLMLLFPVVFLIVICHPLSSPHLRSDT